MYMLRFGPKLTENVIAQIKKEQKVLVEMIELKLERKNINGDR
jgi:hypothetical protein